VQRTRNKFRKLISIYWYTQSIMGSREVKFRKPQLLSDLLVTDREINLETQLLWCNGSREINWNLRYFRRYWYTQSLVQRIARINSETQLLSIYWYTPVDLPGATSRFYLVHSMIYWYTPAPILASLTMVYQSDGTLTVYSVPILARWQVWRKLTVDKSLTETYWYTPVYQYLVHSVD
jgi:hypothetical protein